MNIQEDKQQLESFASALLADHGLPPMKAERIRTATARRPSATTIRLFGSLADGNAATAKIYPANWPFDLQESIRIQRRYAAESSYAVPRILAEGTVEARHIIVEEQIIGATSLAELVASGECSLQEAAQIISDAILAAQSMHIGTETRCARERLSVESALDRAPIPDRHRKRIAAWLSANYTLVSHNPVDAHGDLIPDNILRVHGDKPWCLIDFDLARTTSFLWQHHLRISRLILTTLPGWNDAWAHPSSIAIAFLNRLIEWDIILKVAESPTGAFEHAFTLAQAAEQWADSLGPPARQTPSPLIPIPQTPANGIQIFWPYDGQIKEENSIRANWPADDSLHLMDFPAESPVSGTIRIDPAEGSCAIHLRSLHTITTDGTTTVISVEQLRPSPRTLLIPDDEDCGIWCVCLDNDPQLYFDISPSSPINQICIHAAKSTGINSATADRLTRLAKITSETLAPLLTENTGKEQRAIAQLRCDLLELQARLSIALTSKKPIHDDNTTHDINQSSHNLSSETAKAISRLNQLDATLLNALHESRAAGERWANRCVEAETRLHSAQTQSLDNQKLISHTNELHTTLAVAQTQANERLQQIISLHADKSALDSQDAVLRQQLEHSNAELATLKGKTTADTATINILTSERRELYDKHISDQLEIQRLTQERDQLITIAQADKAAANSQTNDFQQKINHNLLEIQQLTIELNKSIAKYSESSTQLDKIRSHWLVKFARLDG